MPPWCRSPSRREVFSFWRAGGDGQQRAPHRPGVLQDLLGPAGGLPAALQHHRALRLGSSHQQHPQGPRRVPEAGAAHPSRLPVLHPVSRMEARLRLGGTRGPFLACSRIQYRSLCSATAAGTHGETVLLDVCIRRHPEAGSTDLCSRSICPAAAAAATRRGAWRRRCS